MLKSMLCNELNDISLDPTFVVKLDPPLQQQQVDAMLNGTSLFLNFLHLNCTNENQLQPWQSKSQNWCYWHHKCTASRSRLLKEFLLETQWKLKCIWVFLYPQVQFTWLDSTPTPSSYATTMPFFRVLWLSQLGTFNINGSKILFSCDTTTNIDATNLYKTFVTQLWCLSLECTTTPNKVLLVTTKGQVNPVCNWVDKTLPEIYQQHIANI